MKPSEEHEQTGRVDPTALFELSVAYWSSCALFAGLELGVFEALAKEPRSPAALSQTLGLPERSLKMLLEALVSIELVSKDDAGVFGASAMARDYLCQGAPRYLGEAIMFNARSYDSWGRLGEAVKADAPAQSHEHILGEDPEATRNFVYAMHHRAQGVARCLASLLDLADCRRLLDLGGGPGTYSMLLAERFPELECTVIDLPAIVGFAAEIVADSPAAGRIELRAGDVFVDDYGAGYDAVLISGVLHRTEGESAVAFLQRAAAAVVPGGLVAVSDLFTGTGSSGPVRPELFSLHMLVTANEGQALPLAEMERVFEAAGLKLVETTPYPPPLPHTLCLARKS